MTKENAKLPKAVAGWAFIDKPSKGFDDTKEPAYEILLRWKDHAAVAKYVALVKQMVTDEFGKASSKVKPLFKVDEKTGDITLKAKSTFKPTIYDVHGQLLDVCPRVYGGSIVRAAVTFDTWTHKTSGGIGVKAYLNSIQIIKLVTGGDGTTWDDASDDEDAEEIESVEETTADVEEDEVEETKPVAKTVAKGKAAPAKRGATDF